MEIKKVFSALLLIMAMTLLTADPDKAARDQDGSAKSSRTWVNSPPVEYNADGNRVSNYPPYHQSSR